MHRFVHLYGHVTTAIDSTAHSIICNSFAHRHGTIIPNPPPDPKPLVIGGPGGAIYLPYLALHLTTWSTQKGMSTLQGPGAQSRTSYRNCDLMAVTWWGTTVLIIVGRIQNAFKLPTRNSMFLFEPR